MWEMGNVLKGDNPLAVLEVGHRPRPKVETIKLKTIKGRIRIDMNIKKSMIYFEPGIVRVAIDLDYK